MTTIVTRAANGVALTFDQMDANFVNLLNGKTEVTDFNALKTSLKPVAFSGNYSDLIGAPAIPAAQVNADWNAASGVAQILNKPAILPDAPSDGTSYTRNNGAWLRTINVDANGNATVTTSGSNGLVVTSANTNSTGIGINSTGASGHSYTLFSAGSAGGPTASAGSFGLYDNTAAAVRWYTDTSGATQFNGGVVASGSMRSATGSFVGNSGGAATLLQANGNGPVYLRVNSATGAGDTIHAADGAVTHNCTSGNPSVTLNGGGAGGGHLLFQGTGTYPQKIIRALNSNLDFVNNGNSAVMVSITDYGGANSSISTHAIYPASDNAYPIGTPSARFTVIYATTGTINTCDAREKTSIVPNTLGLDFVNALPIGQFKFTTSRNVVEPVLGEDGEGILDENGKFQETITALPGVRNHVGPLAQDVATALTQAGIDPGSMGMWVLDDPANPDSLQGLRPDQLMWVLWTAVQELSAQVQALKANGA